MLHNFTNTTNSYLVLGNAPNRFVVGPGLTQSFDADFLIAEDLDQIAAGQFTVAPPLPAGVQDAVDAGSDSALHNKIVDWIISNDMQIVFADAGPLAGVAGGAAVPVVLRMTDGDGTLDTFNDVATVTVAASLSGSIAESMPIKFENGLATINVSDAVGETSQLSLSSGPAGINVSDTLDIIFSV